jgi:hypothetical protein
MDTPPKPGSDEAIAQGCTCPVLDNAHGAGFPWPPAKGPCFWINEGCPLHWRREFEEAP